MAQKGDPPETRSISGFQRIALLKQWKTQGFPCVPQINLCSTQDKPVPCVYSIVVPCAQRLYISTSEVIPCPLENRCSSVYLWRTAVHRMHGCPQNRMGGRISGCTRGDTLENPWNQKFRGVPSETTDSFMFSFSWLKLWVSPSSRV